MALQKREKKMLIGLAVVAVVSGIILYRVFNPPPADPVEDIVTTPKSAATATATSGSAGGGGSRGSGGGSRGGGGGGSSAAATGTSIPSSEYQKHATAKDCWVIVNDSVFDVTNIINQYPQYAQSITQYCGTFGFESGFLSENSDLRLIIESQASRKGEIK